MKYTFLSVLLIFTFSFLSTSAQQNHFIYFQTENKQPFYIKLDNKIFSSSSSGYLILPKLKDGDYAIKFGSTKNEWPEQTINYKLNKDAGFIFKNFGEKGWGLFNLQSLDIIMAGNNNAAASSTPPQEVKDDDFSKMLANVVNDSTIKQKDIVIKEEVKEAPKEMPKQAVAVPVDTVIPQAGPAETLAPILNSVITRNLKVKNKDGMELVYTDEYNNKKDIIRIFIPAEKINEKDGIKPAKPTVQEENKTDSNKVNSQQDSIKTTTSESVQLQAAPDTLSATDQKKDTTESIVKNIFEPNLKDTSGSIVKDTSQAIAKENPTLKEDKIEFLPATSGKINPDCKGYATEEDFFKLRKKMVAENNEENMIKVAKKVFKAKCFTTAYIRNLSTLFLNDEGKYNFFDAAYPYVSDTGVFSTLENQLTDAYYAKRFKAMIHQ